MILQNFVNTLKFTFPELKTAAWTLPPSVIYLCSFSKSCIKYNRMCVTLWAFHTPSNPANVIMNIAIINIISQNNSAHVIPGSGMWQILPLTGNRISQSTYLCFFILQCTRFTLIMLIAESLDIFNRFF